MIRVISSTAGTLDCRRKNDWESGWWIEVGLVDEVMLTSDQLMCGHLKGIWTCEMRRAGLQS